MEIGIRTNLLFLLSLSLFYCCWNFCNDRFFEGKWNTTSVANALENMVLNFTRGLKYNHSLPRIREAKTWMPPKLGWWKINYYDAFKTDKATAAVVIRDDSAILVEAHTDSYTCNSVFEAEARVVEWAISLASSKEWKNFVFSSDALEVVEEALSHKLPRG